MKNLLWQRSLRKAYNCLRRKAYRLRRKAYNRLSPNWVNYPPEGTVWLVECSCPHNLFEDTHKAFEAQAYLIASMGGNQTILDSGLGQFYCFKFNTQAECAPAITTWLEWVQSYKGNLEDVSPPVILALHEESNMGYEYVSGTGWYVEEYVGM